MKIILDKIEYILNVDEKGIALECNSKINANLQEEMAKKIKAGNKVLGTMISKEIYEYVEKAEQFMKGIEISDEDFEEEEEEEKEID